MWRTIKNLYQKFTVTIIPRIQRFVVRFIDILSNVQRKTSDNSWHALFLRYGFTLMVVGAVTFIRIQLAPHVGSGVSFLMYYTAIMISTAYGGFGPGILSVILSTIIANYYFIVPGYPNLPKQAHLLRVGIFFAEGALLTIITSSLRLLRIETKQKTDTIVIQQEELQRSMQRTVEILHNIEDGYYAINKDWIYLDVNPKGGEMAGYPHEYMIGKNVWDLFPDSHNSPFYLALKEAMQAHKHVRFEGQAAHSNKWYESNIYPTPEGISVFSKDVTEQVMARLKLEKSEEHFRTLVEAVEDYAIFAMDIKGKITSWNEGVEAILGYTQHEAIGMHFSELFTEEDKLAGLPEQELLLVQQKGEVAQEGLRKRKDGSTFHAVATITAIRDEQGHIKGFSKIMRDITEKKEAEETIRYQAYHDTLTGLANRDALYERFAPAKALALRNNKKLAILFLDLDRFKVINDTLGHEVGDLILREVADRLKRAVRAHDLVVRLGGDEFIIMLTEIKEVNDIITVAEKILKAFEPVMRVQDQSLHISTSFGIAVYPEDGEDLHTLMKNADVALYRAKDEGRNRFQFYNYRMNLQSTERLLLEQDLRVALRENQLKIAYQPFVNITTGKVAGVEALVRWNHPRLGILSPADFIPIAEETGTITPIGNWILKTVCEQGVRWHEAGLPLVMSINLSARQFTEENIVESILKILRETQFDPKFLELEITETIAMENIARTSNKLAELKQHGITIAIDDFGTGYSSLSYLKRFPVHKLKIDKSFIKHAFEDAHDLAIVRAIISMGNSMNLRVCAEGVEHESQMQLLSAMECDFAQGYFVSKPQFADSLTTWLEQNI